SFSGIPTRALPNESSASSVPFPPANNVNKGAQYGSDKGKRIITSNPSQGQK
ncbi:42_t:CDS:2, partial [Funneliformis mosseae]